jgi:hypothetical protein
MTTSADPASPPGPAAPPGTPAPGTTSDPVAEVVAWWDRAATNVKRMLDGTYSSDDAAKDASDLQALALECGQKVFDFWSGLLGLAKPHGAAQPSAKVPCEIAASITDRPLTLCTTGFRAIGYGPDYFIVDADVSITPSPEVARGAAPGFTLIVDWHHLPPEGTAKTIIYEGEVFASQTGKLVTTPIRFIKPAYAG